MNDLSAQIRDTARSLLSEGRVDVVIGYEWGPLPLQVRPVHVRSVQEVDRLIWNPLCGNNLSSYLLISGERVGIVAKGCDARAIAAVVSEKQVERDKVMIIAVPCEGVIDRSKIDEALQGREIREGTVSADAITVVGEDVEQTLPIDDLIFESCRTCNHPTAPHYDVLVGENLVVSAADADYPDVDAIEQLRPAERWAYFEQEFSRCIRCYACRQACALCYCQECFVDQTQPAWLSKSGAPSDNVLFHVMRAMHLAGRCVGCGACARACPMHIDLMAMNHKLIEVVQDRFGAESGMEMDAVPLLSTVSMTSIEERER